MTKADPRPRHPDRKISENFLDFAAPLLGAIPQDAGEADFDAVLKVAFMVWNAVVYADTVDNQTFLSEMRELMAHDLLSLAAIEEMIRRKRELFGDDDRLIGEYTIAMEDGGFNLRAEARTPYSEIRKKTK